MSQVQCAKNWKTTATSSATISEKVTPARSSEADTTSPVPPHPLRLNRSRQSHRHAHDQRLSPQEPARIRNRRPQKPQKL